MQKQAGPRNFGRKKQTDDLGDRALGIQPNCSHASQHVLLNLFNNQKPNHGIMKVYKVGQAASQRSNNNSKVTIQYTLTQSSDSRQVLLD